MEISANNMHICPPLNPVKLTRYLDHVYNSFACKRAKESHIQCIYENDVLKKHMAFNPNCYCWLITKFPRNKYTAATYGAQLRKWVLREPKQTLWNKTFELGCVRMRCCFLNLFPSELASTGLASRAYQSNLKIYKHWMVESWLHAKWTTQNCAKT